MPYTFVTPTVEEGPIGGHRLFEFYKMPRGITIIKYNNEYYEMRYPSEDDFIGADAVYVGGHEYVVSDSEADDLTDAGYGDYLTEIV